MRPNSAPNTPPKTPIHIGKVRMMRISHSTPLLPMCPRTLSYVAAAFCAPVLTEARAASTSAGSLSSLHMGSARFSRRPAPSGRRRLRPGAPAAPYPARARLRRRPSRRYAPRLGALRLCLFPLGPPVFQRLRVGVAFFPFRTLCLQFQLGLCRRPLLPGKPLQRKLGFLPGGTGHFGRLGRRLGAVPARGRAAAPGWRG